VPRQNSETFDFHLGNNVTNLSRNSLIFKVSRHFGEAQDVNTVGPLWIISAPSESQLR
jgi:hypothetical protein